MINLLLRAKHWQLFLLTFVIPMIFQLGFMGVFFARAFGSTEPDPTVILSYFKYFPILIVLIGSVQFAWFWAVGVGLHNKVPENIKLSLIRFKLAFLCIIITIVVMVYAMTSLMSSAMTMGPSGFNPAIPGVMVLFAFLSTISIIYIYYFIAKTLKTAELQRELTIGDYIGEFFLIYFFPIGIWFIQPKVNEIYTGHSTSDQFTDVL